MGKSNDRKLAGISLLNMGINIFWSVFAFLPLLRYIAMAVPLGYWIGWLLVSLVMMLLPSSWYDQLQLSSRTSRYISLGVKKAMMITQNGTLVNGLVRNSSPGTRLARLRNKRALRRDMRMYERFHYGVGTFMLLVAFYAMLKTHFGWAIALVFINLFYNVYPILIQQYLKLKLYR